MTTHTADGQYAIIQGTAYPRVIPGDNPTRHVHASLNDRRALYNDAAIRLCDEDLTAFNGTEGAPLCVEHNPADVVGRVHHSFIDDGRCLRIWGRIPLTDRGKDIVADIQAGRIAGLSVSYGNSLQDNGITRKLTAKTFREISLVKKPFFSGCDLTVGVIASEVLAVQGMYVCILQRVKKETTSLV